MYDYFALSGFLPECERCASKDVENVYEKEPEEIVCGQCLIEQLEEG